MPESTQHKLDRIRPPRVQITYDVEIGGAIQKKELPLVVGILADLSGKPDTPLPPLPATACPFDEGLHRVLSSIPPRVAAFMLHTSREPPPWFYQESATERAEREMLSRMGAWVGG